MITNHQETREDFQMQGLLNLGMDIGDRQKLLAHASSTTTKIYTHPNFDLAMQYVNRIAVYGKPNGNQCSKLKMIKRNQTKLNVKRKSINFRQEIKAFRVQRGKDLNLRPLGYEPNESLVICGVRKQYSHSIANHQPKSPV